MGKAAFLGGFTYVIWAVASILYGVTIWGSSSTGMNSLYVVGLGESIDNQQVNVTLGFDGICLYSTPSDSGGNSISKCLARYNFPAIDEDGETVKTSSAADKEKIVEHLFDEMNLEDNETLNREKLGEILLVARVLKDNIFSGNWMIAAFALLVIAGFLSIFPLFFVFQKRRNVCMWIMAIDGLCMGGGFMAAGAAALSNQRALALLENEVRLESILAREAWPIEIINSPRLHMITWATVGMNGAFIAVTTLAVVVRNLKKYKNQAWSGDGYHPPMSGVGPPRKPVKPNKGKKWRVTPGIKKFRKR